MGVPSDDVVLIRRGKEGEPTEVTVNCPDKAGLGCDVCRIVFDFGLYIVKGDLSTDGIWCYIVLWVIPRPATLIVRWSNLRDRLLSVCPPCSMLHRYYQTSAPSATSSVYLLKFFCLDRKGLLHDVTQVLSELELTIQRVKVTTTPDGRVLDLFFITDNLELLDTKKRQEETYAQLRAVLGESCISCEIMSVGPEFDCHQSITSMSQEIAEELFTSELSDREAHTHALSPELSKLKKASVTMDNTLSPSHTLLQIHCVDQKGILYDLMRPLKDCNIQVVSFFFVLVPQSC
uniref:ACT domain-containing protein ACR n=1 Tax=Kalanchoe fedtschenkoi TaxID=63787 RepID=A0A7N0ZZG3_KALFE